MSHDRRKIYVPMLDPMHGGTITFSGNQKGKITRVGMININPYPPIKNVLFVEGLKHNYLA